MSNRNILMTKEVYDQILDTIVAQHPETGEELSQWQIWQSHQEKSHKGQAEASLEEAGKKRT